MIPVRLIATGKAVPSHSVTSDSLARYSIVNRKVKNHSSPSNSGPWRAATEATLLSTTTVTLIRMAAISTRSNARPARVSDSKITLYMCARQPASGLPYRFCASWAERCCGVKGAAFMLVVCSYANYCIDNLASMATR